MRNHADFCFFLLWSEFSQVGKERACTGFHMPLSVFAALHWSELLCPSFCLSSRIFKRLGRPGVKGASLLAGEAFTLYDHKDATSYCLSEKKADKKTRDT